MDIDGCRRRRSVTIPEGNRLMNFNCDGENAPPCTVKRGDTVYFDVEFSPGKQWFTNTFDIINNKYI